MEYVQEFIKLLCESEQLADYNKIRVFLDEDYNSAEHFTVSRIFFFQTNFSLSSPLNSENSFFVCKIWVCRFASSSWNVLMKFEIIIIHTHLSQHRKVTLEMKKSLLTFGSQLASRMTFRIDAWPVNCIIRGAFLIPLLTLLRYCFVSAGFGQLVLRSRFYYEH